MLSKVRNTFFYNWCPSKIRLVPCPCYFHFSIKVMQKISTDYEELKKAFESQKCPRDDKIQALRSTGG